MIAEVTAFCSMERLSPAVLEGVVEAESRRQFPVRLTIDRKAAPKGIQIVPFDVTMDGKRHGELFDFLIRTSE